MTAYPAHQSDFFKATVGSLAFTVFNHVGTMSHGLAEAIPGANEIAQEGDAQMALQQLLLTLDKFEQYQGQIAEHFAYGALSKEQAIAAHVLHIRNHLTEIITT